MQEIVKQRLKQTSLSLVQNKIQAIRRKDISRTGCRVIKNNKISVAGGLGKVNESLLFKKAEEFLEDAVEYPVDPGTDTKYKKDFRRLDLSDEKLCREIEDILDRLKKMHPDFYISNKVNLSSIEYSIANDQNLDLSYYDSFLTTSLLLKESSSTGIMDTFFAVSERKLNKEKIINAVDQIINAYKNKIELPTENLPIIIDQSTLTRLFLRDLNGKMVGNKASLFQEQFDQKLFSEDFTLKIANNPEETFSPEFDLEGTIVEPGSQILIESGILKRPYTDKRTARKYGFENTGCAGGAYDSVPSLRPCMLEIAPGNKTLKDLLNGKKGILIGIASGGDFTSDGRFASPVQVAYLTDGEKLLGRLPEITISGSIFDFFADDFVGMSSDKIYVAGDERLAVVNLKVDKL